MRPKIRCLLLAAGLGLVPLTAPAADLSVGDPAPPLTVSKWLKGSKADRFEPGRVYVVELWATWCGPCLKSIPHLTELQKKYKDQGVTVVGVSVLEDDQAGVAPFVKDMGDKMDYSVAADAVPEGADPDKGKVASGWMDAAGESGIPVAFLINKQGKVAWIGHPMILDEPLAQVVAGTWDLDAAVAERRDAKLAEEKLDALANTLRKLGPEPSSKRIVQAVDEAIAEYPKLEQKVGWFKFNVLLQDQAGAAVAYGEKLLAGILKDEAEGLTRIARLVVDPDREGKPTPPELKLALKAASRADELTKGQEPLVLDTLALAYYKTGDPKKAAQLQEKVVEITGQHEGDAVKRLEMYRKASASAPARP